MNKDQTWLAFQQMLLAQQQQQMMLQNQFAIYMQFCQLKGLNPNHPNSFNLYYQQFYNYPPQPQPQPQPQPNNFSHNQNNISNNPNNNLSNIPNNFIHSQNNIRNNPNNFINSQNNIGHNPNNNFSNNTNNFSHSQNNIRNSNLANNTLLDINQNINNNNFEAEIFNNNGTIYMSSSVKEVMPRKEETLYLNKELQNQPDTINVTFYSSTGFNIMITASKFTTFEDLFRLYMNRLNINYDEHIGKDILFSLNGKIVAHNTKVPIGNYLKMNNSRIEVLDTGNIKGA